MKMDINVKRMKRVSATEMEIGSIGEIVKSTHNIGTVVLKTYSGLVSLKDPTSTWSAPLPKKEVFMIEVYPPGTVVTLTTEQKRMVIVFSHKDNDGLEISLDGETKEHIFKKLKRICSENNLKFSKWGIKDE